MYIPVILGGVAFLALVVLVWMWVVSVKRAGGLVAWFKNAWGRLLDKLGVK